MSEVTYNYRITNTNIFWSENSTDQPTKTLFETIINNAEWYSGQNLKINFQTFFSGQIVLKDNTYTYLEQTNLNTNEKTYWFIKSINKVIKGGFVFNITLDVWNSYVWKIIEKINSHEVYKNFLIHLNRSNSINLYKNSDTFLSHQADELLNLSKYPVSLLSNFYQTRTSVINYQNSGTADPPAVPDFASADLDPNFLPQPVVETLYKWYPFTPQYIYSRQGNNITYKDATFKAILVAYYGTNNYFSKDSGRYGEYYTGVLDQQEMRNKFAELYQQALNEHADELNAFVSATSQNIEKYGQQINWQENYNFYYSPAFSFSFTDDVLKNNYGEDAANFITAKDVTVKKSDKCFTLETELLTLEPNNYIRMGENSSNVPDINIVPTMWLYQRNDGIYMGIFDFTNPRKRRTRGNYVTTQNRDGYYRMFKIHSQAANKHNNYRRMKVLNGDLPYNLYLNYYNNSFTDNKLVGVYYAWWYSALIKNPWIGCKLFCAPLNFTWDQWKKTDYMGDDTALWVHGIIFYPDGLKLHSLNPYNAYDFIFTTHDTNEGFALTPNEVINQNISNYQEIINEYLISQILVYGNQNCFLTAIDNKAYWDENNQNYTNSNITINFTTSNTITTLQFSNMQNLTFYFPSTIPFAKNNYATYLESVKYQENASLQNLKEQQQLNNSRTIFNSANSILGGGVNFLSSPSIGSGFNFLSSIFGGLFNLGYQNRQNEINYNNQQRSYQANHQANQIALNSSAISTAEKDTLINNYFDFANKFSNNDTYEDILKNSAALPVHFPNNIVQAKEVNKIIYDFGYKCNSYIKFSELIENFNNWLELSNSNNEEEYNFYYWDFEIFDYSIFNFVVPKNQELADVIKTIFNQPVRLWNKKELKLVNKIIGF